MTRSLVVIALCLVAIFGLVRQTLTEPDRVTICTTRDCPDQQPAIPPGEDAVTWVGWF